MLLQLADVVDNEAMQVYMKPSSHEESKAPSKGFVVRDAPWATVNNEKVSAACAAGLGAQGVWHPSPRTCSEVWPSYLSWGNQACSSLGSRDSSEGLSCGPCRTRAGPDTASPASKGLLSLACTDCHAVELVGNGGPLAESVPPGHVGFRGGMGHWSL